MARQFVQVENVEVLEDNHIKFDFLGKDSIRYENEVAVHPKIHSLVRAFCKTGKDGKGALTLRCTSLLRGSLTAMFVQQSLSCPELCQLSHAS